ncbi:MAG: hypothetical protein ACREEE_07460 [Dongiaceae bacterium]
MYATIDKLREISRRCLADESLSNEQLRWLGQSLTEFLSHRARSIDEALGLRFARGGVPWWLEEAIRKRDDALRQLTARNLLGLSVTAQARQIHAMSAAYHAAAWRVDQERSQMPANYCGMANEWLWRAFRSGAPMPISERQLRHVLGRA